MAGTLTPTPYQTVLDADGVAVSGALIYTYVGGTTTAATTYADASLATPNTNPIVADSAGRFVAYLPAGGNFKFTYKTAAGATIEEQDNILSVPGAAVNLDIEGTVGEAVTAGQVCYLSSGAEAIPLTPGLWYLTDADAAATSTLPQSVGVAVSAIAINTAGTIRLAGTVTTASAVVVGSTYYVSATAGALTATPPVLSRQVGVALTTSSLLMAGTTAISVLPNPISQDVLFVDATYDIGKSGANRPRDFFQSRNATIGGTLGVTGATTLSSTVGTGALAVTGTATVSSTLVVTGATTLSTLGVTGVTTLTGGLNTPLTVPNGGTGVATQQAYGVLVGGTTATGAMQSIVPGTSGFVLTSAGTGALPTWAADSTLNLASSDGRLTLTTGTPVTTADVTAATTLYWTPYGGNQVALYDGAAWAMYTFTERSIAVPASTSQMYDVFVYNNAGTITLELTAWTNDTTRATALVFQNGVYVKTGALTRRYLGSFRTTTVSGQTEDSFTKRYVWNAYNRVERSLRFVASGSWTYSSTTLRQANGSTSSQLDVVVGLVEDSLSSLVQSSYRNTVFQEPFAVTIGLDSTTTRATGATAGYQFGALANNYYSLTASYEGYPTVGRHTYTWLEATSNTGTTTIQGTSAEVQSGIYGQFRM